MVVISTFLGVLGAGKKEFSDAEWDTFAPVFAEVEICDDDAHDERDRHHDHGRPEKKTYNHKNIAHINSARGHFLN